MLFVVTNSHLTKKHAILTSYIKENMEAMISTNVLEQKSRWQKFGILVLRFFQQEKVK